MRGHISKAKDCRSHSADLSNVLYRTECTISPAASGADRATAPPKLIITDTTITANRRSTQFTHVPPMVPAASGADRANSGTVWLLATREPEQAAQLADPKVAANSKPIAAATGAELWVLIPYQHNYTGKSNVQQGSTSGARLCPLVAIQVLIPCQHNYTCTSNDQQGSPFGNCPQSYF